MGGATHPVRVTVQPCCTRRSECLCASCLCVSSCNETMFGCDEASNCQINLFWCQSHRKRSKISVTHHPDRLDEICSCLRQEISICANELFCVESTATIVAVVTVVVQKFITMQSSKLPLVSNSCLIPQGLRDIPQLFGRNQAPRYWQSYIVSCFFSVKQYIICGRHFHLLSI